jgi:hypothetical protein
LETKRLPGSATPSAIPGFARRALLLVVAVVLTGAALSPQAVFSSTTIVWYASAVMIFVSFVNAYHIVCSWQIFYRNPVIQAKYRSRYLAEFVLLPVLYISAFVFATVKVYEIFPEMRFLLFLLVFEGPIFAHHVASQDRGVLAILTADSPAGDYSWVKRFFYPASVLLFSFIYLRPIYLDQGITTTFGNAWLPLLENVFVLCCTAGLGLSLAAVYRTKKPPFSGENIYFLSIAAWCLASMLLIFKVGIPLLVILALSVRHAFMYVVLVRKYFAGRELDLGEGRSRGLALSFWLPTLLLASPLSFVLFYVYIGLPVFGSLLYPSWMGPRMEALYPYFLGAVGASLVHHYHIERYSWRFRDKQLRDHLNRYLLRKE